MKKDEPRRITKNDECRRVVKEDEPRRGVNKNDCGVTRRDLLLTGSAAAAGLLLGRSDRAQAQTPRAKFMRIDVHAHLWTDEYLDLQAGYGKTDTGTQRGRGAGRGDAEIEKRFAMMDAAGVDMQVLSVSPQVPHFADKTHAVTAARKANDLYADVVRRWPKRFAAFGALPLPHVDESLREIERVLGGMGMRGVTITTDVLGRSIADPAFMPIYEELNRRGSVLFVHPTGCAALSPLIANYQSTWMLGAPVEDSMAALHLMARGIPQRFPKLKIVISHLGGALPMLINRMDSISTWEDPKMPERPSLAARRMWYDTVAYGQVSALRAAVETFGAGQIVLGSDFPYESGDLYQLAMTYVRNAGLKPDEVAAIEGRTAAALLALA